MNWIIFLFGSGLAFFLGLGLLFMSAAFLGFIRQRWPVMGATLLAALGWLLILASATPIPRWLFLFGSIATLLWIIGERSPMLQRRRRSLRVLLVIAWLPAVAMEIPFHIMPARPNVPPQSLMVIGDSVTAGFGDREPNRWPSLVEAERQIEVVDLARPGATAKSALQQAEDLPAQAGIIFLEIGGNDLLGSTSASQFERDLEKLLSIVCDQGNAVWMMELPLPPFQEEFGRVERRLAARYKVTLIPKRAFTLVLTASDATLDSIHLSPAGHQKMARIVGDLFFGERVER